MNQPVSWSELKIPPERKPWSFVCAFAVSRLHIDYAYGSEIESMHGHRARLVDVDRVRRTTITGRFTNVNVITIVFCWEWDLRHSPECKELTEAELNTVVESTYRLQCLDNPDPFGGNRW